MCLSAHLSVCQFKFLLYRFLSSNTFTMMYLTAAAAAADDDDDDDDDYDAGKPELASYAVR